MPHIDSHAPGTFCWFELGTTDQARAKAFYRQLFGWNAEDAPIGPNEVYTMFRLDNRDVAGAYTLHQQDRANGTPSHWMPFIAVANADKAAAIIEQHGGTLTSKPFDVMTLGRMTVAKDPTGAHFSIWESKDHAGVGIAAVPGTECWAELIADNPKAAMKFYENVFDWGFSEGQNGYIHIRTGEQYIGGVQTPEQHAQRIPPHWLLYFEVGDIDGATAKAQNLGGTVRIPPTDVPGAGRYALIFDPAGADFALWSSPR